jgi:hypothetical protein
VGSHLGRLARTRTGLARGGESRSEALAQLAEVLEQIDDSGEFLPEELDIDPEELDGDRSLPEFVR